MNLNLTILVTDLKGVIMNKSNRPVQELGEISVRPHPDCDDLSACPFAPLPRGEGMESASAFG